MKYFQSLLLSFLILNSTSSQIINTIAGGFRLNGALATQIGMHPVNQVIDSIGNIYIADDVQHLVRKVSVQGICTVIAGTGAYGFSGDGGPAISAELRNPYNVAIDNHGNVFIADSYDHRIRKVSANGIISTIAGNGVQGFSGDGGVAVNASLNGPNALAIDKEGNVFISDCSNYRIRKVGTNGLITTIAGTGEQGYSADGIYAVNAKMGILTGVALDNSGNVLVTDFRIRKINTNGVITTIAGNGTQGFGGDEGLAVNAQLAGLEGSVAVDDQGNIFISDSQNNRVRKVTTDGIIHTIAGDGGYGFSGDGSAATSAEIYYPTGVAVDKQGNILVASNYRIRKINSNGIINTIAGNGSGGYNGEGIPATLSQTYETTGMMIDKAGNIFIAERSDNRVRKLSASGVITTVAGNGIKGYSGDGGLAINAQLDLPNSLSIDNNGNIFIADLGNSCIRKINVNGVITTIAGNGVRGFTGDGGLAINAQLDYPTAVFADSSGNILIADQGNHRIRKINVAGIITTIVGNGTYGINGDGGNATDAQLTYPSSVTEDVHGNIFITEWGNSRVRKIDTNGIINTVAGNGSDGFDGDGGKALEAQVHANFISFDRDENMIVTDGANNRIRKVDKHGIITTIVGGGAVFGDGGLAVSAQLYRPQSAIVDSASNLIIADAGNNRIRIVSTTNNITYTFTGNGNWSDASNWNNGIKPPAVLLTGNHIIVNPSDGGECILNMPLTLNTGASITINPGKKFRVLGLLLQNQ